jgi:WD40 repeat protein
VRPGGSTHGQLLLWDLPSCKQSGVLLQDARLVDDAAWSPDGAHIAALESGARALHVFDTAAWKDHPLAAPDGATALAWLDARRLAMGTPDHVVVVDVTSGAAAYSLDTPAGVLAATKDGRLLATAADEGGAAITLWNGGDGGRARTLASFESTGSALAFSIDGRLLASAGANAAVSLWAVQRGMVNQTLRLGAEVITAVAFSSDGAFLATGGEDGTLLLWQME